MLKLKNILFQLYNPQLPNFQLSFQILNLTIALRNNLIQLLNPFAQFLIFRLHQTIDFEQTFRFFL